MKRQRGEVDLDRRAVMLLGLAGASALVLGKASSALGQVHEQKGLEVKVIKEAESMIQGYRKLRLRKATWQPGGIMEARPRGNH